MIRADAPKRPTWPCRPFALLLLSLSAVGCREPATEKPPVPEVVAEAPVVPPPEPLAVPVPAPTLTRADIVNAAAKAAAAFAEGSREVSPAPLAGRPFLVRIAFGCLGPAAGGAPPTGSAGWTPGKDGKGIRITLEPVDWSQAALFAAPQEAERWEAVEGFWIPRPWLSAETCPKVSADPEGASPVTPQTVGLAAVFERGGSRLGRRDGRAYSFTIKGRAGEDAEPLPQNFTLVLAGRVSAFTDGSAFACTALGPDQRPVCIVAVQLDRVAFEGDGKTLAEWRPS